MHSVTDGQTDRQTDGQTDGQQAAGNSRSYCVTVWSVKNNNNNSKEQRWLMMVVTAAAATTTTTKGLNAHLALWKQALLGIRNDRLSYDVTWTRLPVWLYWLTLLSPPNISCVKCAALTCALTVLKGWCQCGQWWRWVCRIRPTSIVKTSRHQFRYLVYTHRVDSFFCGHIQGRCGVSWHPTYPEWRLIGYRQQLFIVMLLENAAKEDKQNSGSKTSRKTSNYEI